MAAVNSNEEFEYEIVEENMFSDDDTGQVVNFANY